MKAALRALGSLEEIVLHYRAEFKESSDRELRWFAIQPSLEACLRRAGQAVGPGGRRLRHQRRIPQAALDALQQTLLSMGSEIGDQGTFEHLYGFIKVRVGAISGIGPLTIYDTALRIGAALNLKPSVVFLHAGTLDGAKALGLPIDPPFLDLAQLPGALAALDAREAEDVLCIYKADLVKLRWPSDIKFEVQH